MRSIRCTALLAVGFLATLVAAPSRADDLPTVDQVVEKYIEATGGKAAYDKLTSLRMTGSMELPGGLKATVKIDQAEPGKEYTVVEIDQFGKIESGTDGKVVWEINPMTGARIKDGAERAAELRSASVKDVLEWKKQFASAKVEGTEDVGGKTCYKVVFTPRSGEGAPETNYYDKASGLSVKSVRTISSPNGEMELEIKMEEFKKVGEFTMPHRLVQSIAGMDITINIDTIEINPTIDKSRFELPEEIKKLTKEG